jgi:hypothetical protein
MPRTLNEETFFLHNLPSTQYQIFIYEENVVIFSNSVYHLRNIISRSLSAHQAKRKQRRMNA